MLVAILLVVALCIPVGSYLCPNGFEAGFTNLGVRMEDGRLLSSWFSVFFHNHCPSLSLLSMVCRKKSGPFSLNNSSETSTDTSAPSGTAVYSRKRKHSR